MTDSNCTVSDAAQMTFPDLLEAFLPSAKDNKTVLKKRVAKFLGEKRKFSCDEKS